MKKYVLFLLVCSMPISLGAFRRKLIKQLPLHRPPRQISVPQKVQESIVKPVIQEIDMPTVFDAVVADQVSITPDNSEREMTKIKDGELIESKAEIVESILETVQDVPATIQDEPTLKVEEVLIVPPATRLLHIAAGERDKKELAEMIQSFDFECSSCLRLDGEGPPSYDIAVVSNMRLLRELAPHVDSFKQIVLWVRGRCTENEYELLRAMAPRKNVRMVVCTPYEKAYMKHKGIEVDRAVVIWPQYIVPVSFTDRRSLFLPAGLQESQFRRVMAACAAQDICIRDEAHRGTAYCAASEGMLCVPGILPDHFLFEHLQQGVVQFVPTIRFLKRLGFVSRDSMNSIHMSEWYCPDYADFIQYFNSWDDLKTKMREVDYAALAKKMEQLGLEERQDATTNWKELFEEIRG